MKLSVPKKTAAKYFLAQCLRLKLPPKQQTDLDAEFDNFLKIIGVLIASKRTEAGMRQGVLAKHCKINNSALCRLEKGRREITLRCLYKVICCLNMGMDEFFSEACRIKKALNKLDGQ